MTSHSPISDESHHRSPRPSTSANRSPSRKQRSTSSSFSSASKLTLHVDPIINALQNQLHVTFEDMIRDREWRVEFQNKVVNNGYNFVIFNVRDAFIKSVTDRIRSKNPDWEFRITKSNDVDADRVFYLSITLEPDVLKSMKKSRRSCLNRLLIAFFVFVLFLTTCFTLEYTLPKGDMKWFSDIIQSIFSTSHPS